MEDPNKHRCIVEKPRKRNVQSPQAYFACAPRKMSTELFFKTPSANNNHMADCPKALASLTNTYAGSVSTLGQCTTCTRWQEAGTNKYVHPVTNNNAGRSIFYHPLHCHGDHTVHTDHYTVVLQAPRMLPWLLPLGYSCPIG